MKILRHQQLLYFVLYFCFFNQFTLSLRVMSSVNHTVKSTTRMSKCISITIELIGYYTLMYSFYLHHGWHYIQGRAVLGN